MGLLGIAECGMGIIAALVGYAGHGSGRLGWARFGHLRRHAGRLIRFRGADLAAGYPDSDWVLHYTVAHVGLAVQENGDLTPDCMNSGKW